MNHNAYIKIIKKFNEFCDSMEVKKNTRKEKHKKTITKLYKKNVIKKNTYPDNYKKNYNEII